MTELINIINQNPWVIFIGFICSLIGTIELMISLLVKISTRKEKKKISETVEKIFSHLGNEADFDEIAKQLEIKKSELDSAKKELEIELPRQRKQAILKEQLEYEERIINDAQIRIQQIKTELQTETSEVRKGTLKLSRKIMELVNSKTTKTFTNLLVIFASSLYLIHFLVGSNLTSVFSIVCIIILVVCLYNEHELFREDKTKKLSFMIAQVLVALDFLRIIFSGEILGLIHWIIILVILITIKWSFDNYPFYVLNYLGHFLAVTAILAIFFISDKEYFFILLAVIIECLIILINAIGLYKELP